MDERVVQLRLAVNGLSEDNAPLAALTECHRATQYSWWHDA
jgi:hypothetical protein